MSKNNSDIQNESDHKFQKRVNSNQMNSIQQTPNSQPFLDDSILFNQDPFLTYTPISEIKQEDHFSKLLDSNNQSIQKMYQFPEPQGQRQIQSFDSLNNSQQTSNSQNVESLDSNINHMTIYCNQSLKNFGYSVLGGLINPKQEDIMQTLNCVYELLSQRQRDMDFRSSVAEKSAKLEQNYKISQEKNEKYQTEIARMKKQIGSLENQITMVEDKFKKEISKLTTEKDEHSKNLIKLQQKSNQMQNEIRKKESETNRVKEQMKKLTGDKFDKNYTYRNTIELISQCTSNNTSNANNASNSSKPWKNSGFEEFSDQVNQQALTINNKLLSENQAFRNVLILLNNELNVFIKQSKEEYVRKKIKEEGDKDENLKEYYKQHLPDIDLIYFNDDCLNMPYERVGSLVIDIFKENFKVIKLFLASISSLLYSHNYYQELGKELEKIRDNLLRIRSTIDVTKILFTDRSLSLPSQVTQAVESLSILNQHNSALDSKNLHFEIPDFKSGNIILPQQNCVPSSTTPNVRSLSTNKQGAKGALTIISNNNISSNTPNNNNNNNINNNLPILTKNSSSTRNTSQNRGGGVQSLNINDKKIGNKQNTINNTNNSNGLHLIKKEQQVQQKVQKDEGEDQKIFNSAKIEQMIKEKLNARLKMQSLQLQSGSSSNNVNIDCNKIDSKNQNNKLSALKDNLLSDRSQLNDLEAYFQNYQNENFNFNYDPDKNNNNEDLSLSFVSRVSFRDVPFAGEIDEKMLEGLGITPMDMLKGNSDPKQMQQELKRWQHILSANSSQASLVNAQQQQQEVNEQKTLTRLKNSSSGTQQQLYTLNGLDVDNKQTTKF